MAGGGGAAAGGVAGRALESDCSRGALSTGPGTCRGAASTCEPLCMPLPVTVMPVLEDMGSIGSAGACEHTEIQQLEVPTTSSTALCGLPSTASSQPYLQH